MPSGSSYRGAEKGPLTHVNTDPETAEMAAENLRHVYVSLTEIIVVATEGCSVTDVPISATGAAHSQSVQ
jgi:hypothetical protein